VGIVLTIILLVSVLFILKLFIISAIFSEEIQTIQKRDPAVKSLLEVVLLYQGFML